ncbi:putative beta-glucosidase I [Lachnellula occidentalis]|uniref:beta-glucosidase n=1 Tax=Lachnellula occidentalis TaxID=215460 RepID=A0A8H8UJ78_9HELO|nr:putative beta-glucosidase I [Lachnellula occidentalis]
MGDASDSQTHPSPIQLLDVEDVLKKLTKTEKAALTSGIDFWHTKAIPRLDIPSLRLSDGPNGVRGTRFFNGAPAACFPNGTALAATWDVDLLKEAGVLMGEEAKLKGAHVLLGPTVNMQRSPLGGRGFESFSEDPVLAGFAAAAIVNGVQTTGVVASIKHFVTNDQEHERMAVDSRVTERALREIYLLPFQIAVRDSRPGSFMTAYNKLNGVHLSENRRILQDILRGEWGWEGLVMSDWFGTYSTSGAINAGLDLEMPGPTRWRGGILEHALLSKKITEHTLDLRVREVLKLSNRVRDSGIPQNAPEKSQNTPETAALLRKIGSESIVLLKNESNALPFKKTETVAVIGPAAKAAAYCGGGSATLNPYYAVTPFDGISAKGGSVKYSTGCYAHKMLPGLGSQVKTADGKPGVVFKAFTSPPTDTDRVPVDTIKIVDTNMYLSDYTHPKLTENLWWAEVEAYFTPEESCEFEFGLTVHGTGKLYVDGEVLVDNETTQRPGGSFFNVGTVEETGIKHIEAGKTYNIKVQWASGVTSKLAEADGVVSFGGGGLRIGGARVINVEEEIKKAVELAKSVDQVVLCVGLNSDWEQEGHDRPHMDLPKHTDDLVAAVAAANPKTVVVVQSGTPVTMPWENDVAAVVQAWYGGNETGNAIADILYGDVNPSGKLSLSFPKQVEDNPAYLSYRSERGRVLYSEDVYVGYRYYEATKKAVSWPFGWGLSYTTFKFFDLHVAVDDKSLTISVDVENTGLIDGSEVVQVYLSQQSPSIRRPVKELKGFQKVPIEKGSRKKVEVVIEKKYATSFWDEERDQWIEESGVYDVLVGNSSADTPLKASFEVAETIWWSGL